MQAMTFIVLFLIGYVLPGYYFYKWESEDERELNGYITLGTMLMFGLFALIPFVNIILCLIVGITSEKLFSTRFY